MAGLTLTLLTFLLALATVLLATTLTSYAPNLLTVSDYPTDTGSGTPASISEGTGVTTINVVTGIRIRVRDQADDWTFTITSTNGTPTQAQLLNVGNPSTIVYTLEYIITAGAVGTGLILSPGPNTTLVFSGNSTVLTASGVSSSDTDITIDLRMTIADAATTGKLAGDYVDTLDLTLAP